MSNPNGKETMTYSLPAYHAARISSAATYSSGGGGKSARAAKNAWCDYVRISTRGRHHHHHRLLGILSQQISGHSLQVFV